MPDPTKLTPGEEADLYAGRVAKIDPLQLNDEYIRLPADLAHWNARLAEATEAQLEAELVFERTEAKLFIGWREQLAMEAGAKVTESTVKERVHDDPRYADARMKMIEAEVALKRVRGVVDAIGAKKEMLISLGAHVRKEMDGSPAVRQQHRDAHARGDWPSE